MSFLITSYVNTILIVGAFYFYIKDAIKNDYLDSGLNLILISMFPSLILILIGPQIGLNEVLVSVDVENRSSGIFRNPNDAGLQSNIALVFSLYYLLNSKDKKAIAFLMILISITASFMTFSRMAFITTIVCLGFFFIIMTINLQRVNKKMRKIYYSVVLIIVLICWYISQNFYALLGGLTIQQAGRILQTMALFEGQINEKTTSERSYLFEEGFEMIINNPFVGSGLGAGQYLPIAGKGVHNTFLLVGIDTGIMGLIVFFIFLGYCFFSGFILKNLGYSFLVTGSLLVLILNMFASHNGLETRMVNAIFGITCGILLLPKKFTMFKNISSTK